MAKRRRFRKKYRIVLALLVAVFLFAYSEAGIRSVIQTISESRANVIGTEAMNEAVFGLFEDESFAEQDLITVVYDQTQNVSAIEVDTLGADKVRAQVSEAVLNKLKNLEATPIKIPLGTLLGNRWLSGHGPKVTLKLQPGGYLKTSIVSTFDAVELNQTRHRLVLEMTADLYCMMPFYRSSVQIESDFLLAETIVVGKVPENYTKVITENEELLSRVNDYGAGTNNP